VNLIRPPVKCECVYADIKYVKCGEIIQRLSVDVRANVKCSEQNAGCREVTTDKMQENMEGHPAIYTHEHSWNECDRTHSIEPKV